MCGIVGFRRKDQVDISVYRANIISGSEGLKHRGPDGHGNYEDEEIL